MNELSVDDEVNATLRSAPHFVLLGAGASKAALPNGDKNGVAVPLLSEVASELKLYYRFPDDLRELATEDFEAAYSRLYARDASLTEPIDELVAWYFSALRLPDEPNLYDILLLSLRDNDAVFTFNWDPFLLQANDRLRRRGVKALPSIHFLHGNVLLWYCQACLRRGYPKTECPECNELMVPSRLLFPVEKKNYQDGALIQSEWTIARELLGECFMITVFGYSAPSTDVEAVALLKEAWGDVTDRSMEQVEIIDHPDTDPDQLRTRWSPFIHTHHYETKVSFFDSWIANHPRRTAEAYVNQYVHALFISNNPVPSDAGTVDDLVGWFEPLLDAERRFLASRSD